MDTPKPITSLADLTKLTKASLSGGLVSEEYFYKGDEVEALVAHLAPEPTSDELLSQLEEMAQTARSAFAAWDADQSSMFFLDVSDTADMELGRVVAEQLPALLARVRQAEAKVKGGQQDA